MIDDVDLTRRTWMAAVRLAMIVSVVAATLAVVASTVSDLPEAAIVLPVIVVAFSASWVQTARIRREAEANAPLSHEAISAVTAA